MKSSATIHTEESMDMMPRIFCGAVVVASILFSFREASQDEKVSVAVDYKQALSKSILYFEAQRSGKLPRGQRVPWRGDSGLTDGSDANVDLVGGYYDAGDNVKFGFPMAFTVTMLSWSAVEFGPQLASKGEMSNAMAAVRWGTDYLLKASASDGVLYAEVGDGDSDHSCWERPEDMTTPRTSYSIDPAHPGSDLAGETSAAMAAASVVFRNSDVAYANRLLDRAKKLFDLARTSIGVYSNSIPVAQKFYSSSGYKDELLWAAAWLHLATRDQIYLDYLGGSDDTGGVRSLFSWDDKFVGVQTLVSKLVLEGKLRNEGAWEKYKNEGEQFLCNLVQKGINNVKLSPGGMVWWQQYWNNFQYTTSALLSLVSYSSYLLASNATLRCPLGNVASEELISFSRSQVDYILGENPRRVSYMVGFGQNYPTEVHHRGASIVSIKKDPKPVGCQEGFHRWFNRNSPNPNVLVGAVVGGPDANDLYSDSRSNYQQAEAATVNTAPFVGVLARLA